MKHIIKVDTIQDAKDNPVRPIVALDKNGVLFVEGTKAGPEMIDLGLSVKWAKANIGATCGDTAESWYGGYYAWGETETKSDYSWGTYKHANGTYSSSNKKVFTKYIPIGKPEYWNGEGDPDNKTILDAVDDIATLEFGSNYRMPTKEEIKELIALPNQWVTDYNGISGLNGRVFTGKNLKSYERFSSCFEDREGFCFIPLFTLFKNCL